MSRVREMIERNLGTENLTACLFNGTTEIRARGYRPVPFRNWEIDDDEAIAVVRFGPFDEPVTFDRYAIYEGDQPMIVIPEYSTARFPRGWTWDWQLSIDVVGERLTHYEHL